MQKQKIVLANARLWDILLMSRVFLKAPRRSQFGQTMIESTFSVIVIVILLLGMVKVFFWVGTDLANRVAAHEKTLISDVPAGEITDNYRQIRPVFYEGTPLDGAAFESDIFGSNRLRR